MVKRLARRLGVPHRTLRWRGEKPATRLQEAARDARYRLLAAFCKTVKAGHVATAHTLDDQAETVLIRMSRGSGLTGLAAMARAAPLPAAAASAVTLVRPLLDIPKARLVATLEHAKIDFADDGSNRDPRFTRARLRTLMPALAREGLDARPPRIAGPPRATRRCGDRHRRRARPRRQRPASRGPIDGPIVLDAEKFARLPAEVALRLLGRAIGQAGDEGRLQLGKLEALYEELGSAEASPERRVAAPAADLGGSDGDARSRAARGRARPGAGDSRRSRNLNHGQIWRARRFQTALEWEKCGRFPWQGGPRHINCDRDGRESALTCGQTRPVTASRANGGKGHRDECQSAQFRPLGDHRPFAVGAVHAVSESRPAPERDRTSPSRSF